MKKWAKILCCLALFACVLAGCGTVGNINNTEKEIIYNGNAAVLVGNHLYYGNSHVDTDFENEEAYRTSAGSSYLARLDTSKNMTGINADLSPKHVENVASEVTGHDKSFMFVLGQNIYYATPNIHKGEDAEGNVSNNFSFTTIYKSALNGDGKKELYTTTADVTQIETLKFDGKYYIVILAGEKLVKIDLSSDKATELATGVKSAAMPETYEKSKVGSTLDWNGYVYYTTAKSDENSALSGYNVNRVAINTEKAEAVYTAGGTKTITFLDRERDVLVYSIGSEVYVSTKSNNKNDFINSQHLLQATSSISGFNLVTSVSTEQDGAKKETIHGYVFTSGSALNYVTSNFAREGAITFKDAAGTAITGYTTVLVSGRTVYLATTSAIYKADISSVFITSSETVTCQTIVTMTTIDTGAFAFDGDYVYYYAGLETLESEGGETTEVEDDSLYLYRAKISSSQNAKAYQLLSAAQDSDRKNK
ncbi:MAG: hypothetical protein J6K39_03375 [Clostridia bacterium]|nr:hypothetical protein [Clostridia bacterium]